MPRCREMSVSSIALPAFTEFDLRRSLEGNRRGKDEVRIDQENWISLAYEGPPGLRRSVNITDLIHSFHSSRSPVLEEIFGSILKELSVSRIFSADISRSPPAISFQTNTVEGIPQSAIFPSRHFNISPKLRSLLQDETC